MSLMINQNVTALNAWKNLNKTDREMSSTMEKLSSGLRVNRAADDPAGLVISEQMRAQVVGLKAAVKNSEKGISMVQTAEAALDKVHGLLGQMRSLALDSANAATNDEKMLAANQAEIENAIQTISRIAQNTQYGTKRLLDGSNAAAKSVTVGDGAAMGIAKVLAFDIRSTNAAALALRSTAVAEQIAGGPEVIALSGAAFGNPVAAAASLAGGPHVLTVEGQLDRYAFSGGTSGVTYTTRPADFYTGSFSGTYTVENNSGSTVLAGPFTLKIGTRAVGTASYEGGSLTLTMNNTETGEVAKAGIVLGGTFALGSSFDLAVTASTAQVRLDRGPAVAMNREKQVTAGTQTLSSGLRDGTSAAFDLAAVHYDYQGATKDYPFTVWKTGINVTLGEGGKTTNVAAGSARTDYTVTDGEGNALTLAFDPSALRGGETATAEVESGALVFQVGSNQSQTVKVAIRNVSADRLGRGVENQSGFESLAAIDVTTAQGAQDALALIDQAIDEVSTIRGELGAFQKNTLEANLDNLRVAAENLQASESVIRDTDMAAEMATFTKYQIMMQAGTAMLAQANQMPQNLLKLLQG